MNLTGLGVDWMWGIKQKEVSQVPRFGAHGLSSLCLTETENTGGRSYLNGMRSQACTCWVDTFETSKKRCGIGSYI